MDGWYSDLMEIKELKAKHIDIVTRVRMLDDLMDEILMLDDPEAMREVALFGKELLKEVI